MNIVKVCSKCSSSLTLDMFSKNPNTQDGLNFWCKICVKQYNANYHSRPEVRSRRRTPEHIARVAKYSRLPRVREKARERRKTLESRVYDWNRKGILISADEWKTMFDLQDGKCLICKDHQDNFRKRLALDHDHKTGVIRGLLCSRCNTGLGNFRDSIELLESAISYLKNTNVKEFLGAPSRR